MNKKFLYQIQDPFISSSIEINLNECRTVSSLKKKISFNLHVFDFNLILENPPSETNLNKIKDYYIFKFRFDLHRCKDIDFIMPNNKIIRINDCYKKDFHEIIESFREKKLFYSEDCIKNIHFYVNKQEVPHIKYPLLAVPFDQSVFVKMSCQVTAIDYGYNRFIFSEKESVFDAEKYIIQKYSGCSSVSILNDFKKKLKRSDKFRSYSKYSVRVEFYINFKHISSQATSTQILDFLSTVYDAQKQIAIVYSNPKMLQPENIIIYDSFKMEIKDTRQMLKSIQNLSQTFYYDIAKKKIFYSIPTKRPFQQETFNYYDPELDFYKKQENKYDLNNYSNSRNKEKNYYNEAAKTRNLHNYSNSPNKEKKYYKEAVKANNFNNHLNNPIKGKDNQNAKNNNNTYYLDNLNKPYFNQKSKSSNSYNHLNSPSRNSGYDPEKINPKSIKSFKMNDKFCTENNHNVNHKTDYNDHDFIRKRKELNSDDNDNIKMPFINKNNIYDERKYENQLSESFNSSEDPRILIKLDSHEFSSSNSSLKPNSKSNLQHESYSKSKNHYNQNASIGDDDVYNGNQLHNSHSKRKQDSLQGSFSNDYNNNQTQNQIASSFVSNNHPNKLLSSNSFSKSNKNSVQGLFSNNRTQNANIDDNFSNNYEHSNDSQRFFSSNSTSKSKIKQNSPQESLTNSYNSKHTQNSIVNGDDDDENDNDVYDRNDTENSSDNDNKNDHNAIFIDADDNSNDDDNYDISHKSNKSLGSQFSADFDVQQQTSAKFKSDDQQYLIIEEEEEVFDFNQTDNNNDDDSKPKAHKYYYQTNREIDVNDIDLDKEATVKTMKQEIARKNAINNINNIKILFAGKELLDDDLLESLNIGDTNLFVYIRSEDDIRLMAAKDIQADNDQPQFFEEEEEESN